ncbi:MAG: AAA family ATPase [Candidatus Omnitrophica bacterium]|nr:AAA family ATPase [Candidatus Omnitrophota bacterium]
MSYYKLLGFNKEPFSTSPDPDFFFASEDHRRALLRTMIEVRLKRGLSVILGDVGIGKTTLSRKLFQMLKERHDVISHMVLDPVYDSQELFLESLLRIFGVKVSAKANILDLKIAIKNYLFQKGVREKKTIVLLIDEAQKLDNKTLETLRLFLNYETNDHKLLQVVLMGQNELLDKIRAMKNLWDRAAFKCVLRPFTEDETIQMVNFRIKQAGYCLGQPLFYGDALKEIYNFSSGYPRRTVMACHNALKKLAISNERFIAKRGVKELLACEIF